MAISCVYCGGTHGDARQARACWQQHQGVEVATDPSTVVGTWPANAIGDLGAAALPRRFADSVDRPGSELSPQRSPDRSSHASSATAALRSGPAVMPRSASNDRTVVPPRRAPRVDAGSGGAGSPRAAAVLGRNAIVAVGQSAPTGWEDAERPCIDAAALAHPVPVIAALRRLADERRPVVFEIDDQVSAQLDQPAVATDAPHDLGPRFELNVDTLRHLIIANSVDWRGDRPVWPLIDAAVGLGATPTADGSGDIQLADGTRLWIDGGPLRFSSLIEGIGVVHRIAVEHDSLVPFGDNDCAADLAPDQLAAVTHDGGAARIIAPAGSGKTRVLTERARHLLRRWQLPASAVCLLAFNKRAQEEMAQRTTELRGLQIRTLNALALALVNGSAPFAAQPQRLRTVDEPEVRRIIGSLVSFPRRRNADPIATWIEALAVARLGLRDPQRVESMYDGEVDGFAEMYPRYRAELRRAGAVDFDEQILQAIELLLTDPAARAAAQRACRVLLVDEFQDLTPAHILLVRLLAGPDGCVFGVGDDDQTIYGYNGADPSWLIDFAELFPGAGDHPLTVNYRCPDGVVGAADMLLRHNRRRVPKVIIAAQPGPAPLVDGDESSVAATLRIIATHVAAGVPTADIAVLARVNSLLAPVQVGLAHAGVAVGGGVGREFMDRTAVRAALAWFRLATGGTTFRADDVAEALRRPSRPLHPNVAKWVGEQTSLDGLRRLAGRLNTERDSERVEAFSTDIERLRAIAQGSGNTARMLAALRDSMGLADSISSLDLHRRGMNKAAQDDDLTAIAQLTELHPDPATFESWLAAGLGKAWQTGGVMLATVHRVKGQEWPIIVVHQADADQFPHRLADDVEEERRVFHVAITRASRQVHLVTGDRPSPFIVDTTTEPSLLREVTVSRQAPAPPAARATRPGHDLAGPEAALFEQLRTLRTHLAKGKPAYTVFADAVLHDIATTHPNNLIQLGRIKGIGPSKLDQYGAAVLAIVEDAADQAR